ncbi:MULTISPECIES: trehalase-like domain-containing protein [Rhodococcus]|uniref:trehalase-like domain-containing protein n=1 Tax=Rhodococcus TaxID=1827 RepID=UPI001ED8DE56|nr:MULTISPECIES: trehalase-like domain-containing protein [Rhodococcus]
MSTLPGEGRGRGYCLGRRCPPQSAAAPSPFPPIAEYAFLSNCHTGALIAPDGSVDWLCVPRFDSPACSDPSSTAGRGCSGSARSGSTFRRPGSTSREATLSRRCGTRRPAG